MSVLLAILLIFASCINAYRALGDVRKLSVGQAGSNEGNKSVRELHLVDYNKSLLTKDYNMVCRKRQSRITSEASCRVTGRATSKAGVHLPFISFDIVPQAPLRVTLTINITCPLVQRDGHREEPMAAVDSDHPCPSWSVSLQGQATMAGDGSWLHAPD